MHAAIYCSKGMECSEAVNKIKKTEKTKRETGLLNFLKSPSNKKGINISGNK